MIGHRHLAHDLLEQNDFVTGENVLQVGISAGGGQADNLKFLFLAGVADVDVEHEAVELGFGQRIGAFLFDGILRGQDEKRLRQAMLLAAGGDLVFLHGLQQCGLGLGRRAVDFVGEDDVGEDGAADEAKLSAAGGLVFLNDLGAGDVRGHQIGGELDAVEAQAQRAGKGGDQKRLGQARDAHQQRMTPAEKSDEQLINDGILTYDHLAQLRPDVAVAFLQLFHCGKLFFGQLGSLGLNDADGWIHGCSFFRVRHSGIRRLLSVEYNIRGG